MRTAKIVRIYDLGADVQLLCSDDRGLLSIYFAHRSFDSFYRKLQNAGLDLIGLKIEFDQGKVLVRALGHRCDSSLN
jgi:hypothetical protein